MDFFHFFFYRIHFMGKIYGEKRIIESFTDTLKLQSRGQYDEYL